MKRFAHSGHVVASFAMSVCDVPVDAQTALYGLRKLLLVLHALGAIVLLGASTHHAVQMAGLAFRGSIRPRYDRIWARTTAIAYVVVYSLGAVLYPTYRYHVRALVLDRYHPAMSNLFDIKENLATIALLLAIAIGVLGGRVQADAEDKPIARVYASMSFIVTAIVWFDVISGLVIASVRSV